MSRISWSVSSRDGTRKGESFFDFVLVCDEGFSSSSDVSRASSSSGFCFDSRRRCTVTRVCTLDMARHREAIVLYVSRTCKCLSRPSSIARRKDFEKSNDTGSMFLYFLSGSDSVVSLSFFGLTAEGKRDSLRVEIPGGVLSSRGDGFLSGGDVFVLPRNGVRFAASRSSAFAAAAAFKASRAACSWQVYGQAHIDG